ncbi:hypothetical protein F5878DRAFT_674759 [Lentinula raphanica]|uniref:SUN domain-containing protein n=1 Tax=Lentinula raphanica TaxID=153919 RepID=A0AA38UJ49_9AGAR|nr:hypothetical protein F5878DRAFT_674759 [Lentinula raphanica]
MQLLCRTSKILSNFAFLALLFSGFAFPRPINPRSYPNEPTDSLSATTQELVPRVVQELEVLVHHATCKLVQKHHGREDKQRVTEIMQTLWDSKPFKRHLSRILLGDTYEEPIQSVKTWMLEPEFDYVDLDVDPLEWQQDPPPEGHVDYFCSLELSLPSHNDFGNQLLWSVLRLGPRSPGFENNKIIDLERVGWPGKEPAWLKSKTVLEQMLNSEPILKRLKETSSKSVLEHPEQTSSEIDGVRVIRVAKADPLVKVDNFGAHRRFGTQGDRDFFCSIEVLYGLPNHRTLNLYASFRNAWLLGGTIESEAIASGKVPLA